MPPWPPCLAFNPVVDPTEIQVANLIKREESTKEIAELLHLSDFTIEAHRRAIRKKLGLAGQKVNLQSFLTQRSR